MKSRGIKTELQQTKRPLLFLDEKLFLQIASTMFKTMLCNMQARHSLGKRMWMWLATLKKIKLTFLV